MITFAFHKKEENFWSMKIVLEKKTKNKVWKMLTDIFGPDLLSPYGSGS